MPKPNKENIVSEILVQLAGNKSYTETFEVILSKFKLSEPTFVTYWKEAGIKHRETQEATQKAIAEQSITMAVEAAKQGKKSKDEYVMEIQTLLDNDLYEESALDFKTGKVIRYHRKLTPLERKALYERISKFEGMDAPAKIAETDSKGNDKTTLIQWGEKTISV
jgi:hypothetical protein